MDKASKKQEAWKSRDAWFCILALVISQFVFLSSLRFAARSSPAFDQWWASPSGTGVIYLIQDALWVFVALWFSGVKAFRGFLERAGLRRGISIFGWCSAWLAITIALVDIYGTSRGLTASARQHPAADGSGAFSLAWCYFTLSAVVIAPLCEEVATRGFLYPAFRGRYSFPVTTVIIICFSAYFHRSSVLHSLYTFGCLISLWALLCVVRERTGSLWDCLFCHALYNLVTMDLLVQAVVMTILFLPFVILRIYAKRAGTAILPARSRDT